MRQIRTIYQYVTAVYYIIIIILLKAADRELRNNCGKSPVKELLDLQDLSCESASGQKVGMPTKVRARFFKVGKARNGQVQLG